MLYRKEEKAYETNLIILYYNKLALIKKVCINKGYKREEKVYEAV
jgi:hypothetical protein